jgi:hypothetical protein
MGKFKIAGIGIGVLVGFLALQFVLGLYGLAWFKFFEPKRENIRREIFENTQSYVHGKIQDLAKYKDEYDSLTDPGDQEALRQIIILRFAEFDESKIRAANLRNFLVRMRGY